MSASARILGAAAFFHGALCGVPSALAAEPTKKECIAAHVSAQAQRVEGKLRASQASLRVCSEASCPDAVRDECTRWLGELKPLLPSVVFEVKDGAGKALREVRVTVDGQPLAEKLDGTALPVDVDPGEHTFTFEIAGHPPVTRKLTVRESSRSVERVTIGVPPPQQNTQTTQPPPDEPSPSSGQRIAGASVAGLGLVGVVVGGLFGLRAISKSADSKAYCGQPGNPNLCSPEGVTLREDSRTAGTVSTVAFVVGGVGLAAGAVLWFTAGSGSKMTTVGISPTGIRIGCVW